MELSHLIAEHGYSATFVGRWSKWDRPDIGRGGSAPRLFAADDAHRTRHNRQLHRRPGLLPYWPPLWRRSFRTLPKIAAATRTADSLLIRYAGASVIIVRFKMVRVPPTRTGLDRAFEASPSPW